ncbi:hypothetical protein MKW94_004778 [Papaver nudicaule]|uniref:non-specific serine/threonine protein kinase n=1 Tax=Papaver nudicaule TaxID=74823 RepID=A0AA41VND4_PAPNU|nr:hypothetical protein [Papaver nudicaule]
MGCSISGLNNLYDAVNGGGDIWINENRFRIVKQIGEGGSDSLYLVKEIRNEAAVGGGLSKKIQDPSHVSADGSYSIKKVLIENEEQLETVREEIRVSSFFSHPNLLPLLDHAIISVKVTTDKTWNHEAYLLFPAHLEGTVVDHSKAMKTKNERFSTKEVLQIFRQEWAAKHCPELFRAPELWDCTSRSSIDERTDIWSLGCTLYALMYGESPFEYVLEEPEGNLQFAIENAQIKWPAEPKSAYPEPLHQFIKWMLQPPTLRPRIDDIIIHVDKLITKYST